MTFNRAPKHSFLSVIALKLHQKHLQVTEEHLKQQPISLKTNYHRTKVVQTNTTTKRKLPVARCNEKNIWSIKWNSGLIYLMQYRQYDRVEDRQQTSCDGDSPSIVVHSTLLHGLTTTEWKRRNPCVGIYCATQSNGRCLQCARRAITMFQLVRTLWSHYFHNFFCEFVICDGFNWQFWLQTHLDYELS